MRQPTPRRLAQWRYYCEACSVNRSPRPVYNNYRVRIILSIIIHRVLHLLIVLAVDPHGASQKVRGQDLTFNFSGSSDIKCPRSLYLSSPKHSNSEFQHHDSVSPWQTATARLSRNNKMASHQQQSQCRQQQHILPVKLSRHKLHPGHLQPSPCTRTTRSIF